MTVFYSNSNKNGKVHLAIGRADVELLGASDNLQPISDDGVLACSERRRHNSSPAHRSNQGMNE
jgi:hypothetical protein